MEPAPAPRLADTERLVVLGAVGTLFAGFLLLQLSYLFGNAPVVAGSGVTFSEYARRGFAELSTVATLCTILLLTLEHWAARGPRERWARLLAIAVVVEVEILLISALRRLWLYESAYGFTTARLYAHVYMVGVALFLGLLGWRLSRGLKAGWLARRAAAIAAVTMIVLIYWNHEAWIVRQNAGASSGPGSSTPHIWSGASRRTRRRPCSGRCLSYRPPRPTRCASGFGSATDRSPAARRAAGSSGIAAGTARWPRSGQRGSWKETSSSILAIASRGDGA